jgi:hypothetical protein
MNRCLQLLQFQNKNVKDSASLTLQLFKEIRQKKKENPNYKKIKRKNNMSKVHSHHWLNEEYLNSHNFLEKNISSFKQMLT